MFDRTNYALTDFLLFSERVYVRMFELHNAAWWPLHLVMIGIGLRLAALAFWPTERGLRLGFMLLAIVTAFVGWAFFIDRYASINWAASYIAPAFFVQAILLALVAARSNVTVGPEPDRNSGLLISVLAAAVLAVAVFGYPFVALGAGQGLGAAEWFGLAPDPTVVATLALLSLARGALVWIAALVPVLWVVVTTLTKIALGSPTVALPSALAVICLALMTVRATRWRGSRSY